MNLRVEAPVLSLEAGQFLSLDDACGTRIQSNEGTVWITEEGEPRDFVVGPGEAYVVTRPASPSSRRWSPPSRAVALLVDEESCGCAPPTIDRGTD